MASIPPCDYAELEQLLTTLGAPLGPAEAHGLASGLLCGGVAEPARAWARELQLPDQADAARDSDAPRRAGALFADLQAHLATDDFAFRLCLPTESEGLGRRAAALRDWCRGFLYGFGLAGARPQRWLSEDAQEALRDLVALSDLDAQSARDESDAVALAELEEFARVAALLIREDVRLGGRSGDT